MNNSTIAILALQKVKLVGKVVLKKLWLNGIFDNDSYYESIGNALAFLKKDIPKQEINQYISDAESTILEAENNSIDIVDLNSSKYPKTLIALKDPPSILFYKGNIEIASNAIGIIGTREPDDIASEIAKRIGTYFHNKGYAICNGLAYGVDEMSIKGEANVLSNVVGVLAAGLNYHKVNTLQKSTARLADKVLENGGLIISEFKAGIKEDTFKVIESCRIQTGVSKGLILIQSKIDGGSKYALKAITYLNRPLGIIKLSSYQNEELYKANIVILENTKQGLSKITGIKPDKILLDKSIPLAKKEDYEIFENALLTTYKTNNNDLF